MIESILNILNNNNEVLYTLLAVSGLGSAQWVGKGILMFTKTRNSKAYKLLEAFCMIAGKVKDHYEEEEKNKKRKK